MRKNKAAKYLLLGAAFLFVILGVSLLYKGVIGWLLIGVALCCFVTFCYLAFFASPNPSARTQKPEVKQQPQKQPPLKPTRPDAVESPIKKTVRESVESPTVVSPPAVKSTSPIAARTNVVDKPIVQQSSLEHPIPKPTIDRPSNRFSRKYTKLFRHYPNQSEKGAFAHFYYYGNNSETQETPFQRLISMAIAEEWDYAQPEFQKPHESMPVLWNYLEHTFLRLQSQKEIAITQDKAFACFNTGLQTPAEKDIFAFFRKNSKAARGNDHPTWWFEKWCDHTSGELRRFDSLPKVATYIKNGQELLFDTNYGIEINLNHIVNDVENQKRLPVELQNNRTLAKAAIKGATEQSVEKCKRNYRLAIPSWYERGQKVQLLLPLYLTDPPEQADLALVADKDEKRKKYLIRTAFTLDMAYRHARVITKPNREWLNP